MMFSPVRPRMKPSSEVLVQILSINGGGGIDTIEYSFIGSGVVVNLSTGLASGGAGNDVILKVENIIGSIFDDSLIGNNGNNTLNGGNGNDILNGGNGNDNLFGEQGNDLLTGGKGKDILTGGEGIDRFNYKTLTDSLLSNFDVIKDFDANTDLFLVKNNPTALVKGGTVATLDQAGISAKLTTTAFKANVAAQFNFGDRTFVAINDSTAGFNANTDAIIEVTGLTGQLNLTDFTKI